MTGAHTGSTNVDMTFANGASGQGQSTYDGHSVSGPSAEQLGSTACPNLEPKEPTLQVATNSLGGGRYRILVTASIVGVGANEADTDTEPVNDATLQLGSVTTYTDAQGTAIITVGSNHQLIVSAGDTLVPTSVNLP